MISSDILTKTLFEDALNTKGSLSLKASGGSMKPFIKAGDYITVVSPQAHSIKIGDIVVFTNKNQEGVTVAHRVVRKDGSLLITKGDFYRKPDPCVDQKELLGKVVKIERHGKTIKIEKVFYRWLGRIIAYLSLHHPLLLFIFLKLISIAQDPRKIPDLLWKRTTAQSRKDITPSPQATQLFR